MIAIVYGRNELNNMKESIKSLRENAEEIELIIAVDNGSSDGTYEWLLEQNDIDIVYFDDGIHTFAKMLNEILTEYNFHEDILLVQASYLAAKHSVGRMRKVLERNPYIGILSPISNDRCDFFDPYDAGDYSDADAISEELGEDGKVLYSLGVHSGTFLLSKLVIKKTGLFEEKLMTMQSAVEDYILRAIAGGYLAAFCSNAFFFNTKTSGTTDHFQSYYDQDMAYMRQKWNMQHFNKCADRNLIDLIDADREAEISVLEIGCDCGADLIAIKNRYPNAHVYGIESNVHVAGIASRYFDVRIRNIEELDTRRDYAVNNFDYIILGDVLEHLREPEKVLLSCQELLKEGGYILTGISNLMHVSVLRDLINGNFTYTEEGLVEKTHVHMFTYYEILKMFSACNYHIEVANCEKRAISSEDAAFIDELMKLSNVPDRELFETYQYVIRAKAKNNLIYSEAPDKTLQSRLEAVSNNPYKGEIHLWKYLIEDAASVINSFQRAEQSVISEEMYMIDSFAEASEEEILQNDKMLEGLTQKDILFALLPVRKMYDGEYQQTALDDYIDTIDADRYLVLEPQRPALDEPIHTRNRCVYNEAAVTSKYGITDSDRNDVIAYVMHNVIYPLEDAYKAKVPHDVSIKAVLTANRIVKEREAYHAFFSEVLDRVKPKVIAYTHGPIHWICYLNEVAHRKGICTVEIAHGAGELNLVYPDNLKYADYFMTHSQLEVDIMKENGHTNVVAVGKPHIYSDCQNQERRAGKVIIGFVSSLEPDLFETAVRMSERLESENFQVLYKLHPGERLRDDEKRAAQQTGVVLINGWMDMREFLKQTDIIVGIRSSALTDALPYERIKIIMLIEEKKYGGIYSSEYTKKLVQAGEIVGAKYEEELYREILSYDRSKKYRPTPNLYWPKESDRLFRDFIYDICDKRKVVCRGKSERIIQ